MAGGIWEPPPPETPPEGSTQASWGAVSRNRQRGFKETSAPKTRSRGASWSVPYRPIRLVTWMHSVSDPLQILAGDGPPATALALPLAQWQKHWQVLQGNVASLTHEFGLDSQISHRRLLQKVYGQPIGWPDSAWSSPDLATTSIWPLHFVLCKFICQHIWFVSILRFLHLPWMLGAFLCFSSLYNKHLTGVTRTPISGFVFIIVFLLKIHLICWKAT